MMERTDNIDEMSVEQLRDELLGAWGRLRNVKAILDDDYDRHKDDGKPIRENVAGDVLMHLHALKRMQASLSAERNSWMSEALEWREHAPINRVEKADLLLDHETRPAPPEPTPAAYPPGYTLK